MTKHELIKDLIEVCEKHELVFDGITYYDEYISVKMEPEQ